MRGFQSLRGDPKSNYDAVVIGAGIGGLICAGLLARAGVKVLLVEQHYMVGGYCSTFKRGPFTFDAATHFYPLLGNPMTITGSLLDRLGSRTKWVKMDPVDHFHFPDGSSFSVSADYDEYLDELKATFPHESTEIDGFFQLAREAYLYGLLYYFRGRPHDRLEVLQKLTLHEVLAHRFVDKKLRLLLAADCAHWGSRPSRTSFVFDSMLRLSYFLGNYYPEGGSQVFADDLARIVTEAGGDILMRSTVERIVVEEGIATGVDIVTGPPRARRTVRVNARHVVSNADLLLTLEKMLGPDVVGWDLIAKTKQMRPSSPCFLVHLGLRDVPIETLERASGYHWRSWNSDDVVYDAFKIFSPSLYEPCMSPQGGSIIILQRIMEIGYDRVKDWSAHKARVEDDLVTRLETVIPGITQQIVTRQSASALTSWRFTLNTHGAMLGWEMSPEQLGDRRPSIEGPVGHLYLTGHWTKPGGGITPVIVSAMDVAQAITGASPSSVRL
jgi:phytoene dehydrogenase-like protein